MINTSARVRLGHGLVDSRTLCSIRRLCLDGHPTSNPTNESQATEPTRTLAHLLIPAVVFGLCVWASGGAASFLPPWRPSHAPLGGIWPPLLALLLGLLGLYTARRGWALLFPAIESKLSPQWSQRLAPATTSAPHRFRIEPIDWLIGLALVFAQYEVLDLYRDFYNPENQAIGHDNYAFLSTAVAAHSGRWDLYMVDKRPLYGIVSAFFAPWFAGDVVRTTVAVSMACMSLLQAPHVLAGATVGWACSRPRRWMHVAGDGLVLPLRTRGFVLPAVQPGGGHGHCVGRFWALFHPGRKSFLIAGLVMAVLTLTQVKNFTFNAPMLALLFLSLLLDRKGHRIQRFVAMTVPIGLAVMFLRSYPVEFTPLNVLVMHHREEVNYEIPYEWDETITPSVRSPSPLSPHLPNFLRGGEFEAVSGVMLTPPNSDVVAAFPQDGPKPRWEVVRATSIPPTPVRLSHNIKQASILAPGIGSVMFPLVALGWLWSLFCPATPMRRRIGLPVGWWRAGVLLVPLASCFGSLSLKFNLRYVFHAAPTLYVLMGLAAVGAAHLVSRNSGQLWQWAAKGMAVMLGISMATALFIRAPLISSELDERIIENAFFRLPPDSRQLMGKGYRLLSAYLDEHVGDKTAVYDCTPIAMGLYRPLDERLIRPKNGSERDKLCKQQLGKEPGSTPRILVLTSIPEFFGPDAVMPQHAARAGWTLLYGYDMTAPRELGDPEDLKAIGSGWLAIFTDTPDGAPAGVSMLNGASPSTTALDTDSPTNPNRKAGRPQDGNP